MTTLTTTLTHRAPAAPLVRPLVVRMEINIDFSLLFWPLYALLWLGWLGLGRAGKWTRRLYEIARAVIVVSGRRFRRWLRQTERRVMWGFSGLVYGPCLGVG